jgi:hypothetical protein
MNTILNDVVTSPIANPVAVYPILKAKDASELAGYNLLPIARTDGKKGKSDSCIQVPAISDSLLTVVYNNATGNAWIRAQVAALQSKLASAANKAGLQVDSVTIGIDSLLAAMQVQEAAARISKESIAAWFDASIASLVTAALTAKGLPEGTHAKILEGFKASFQRLAISDVSLPEAECNQLTKALALIPEDSEVNDEPMTEKIAARLLKASERTVEIANAL